MVAGSRKKLTHPETFGSRGSALRTSLCTSSGASYNDVMNVFLARKMGAEVLLATYLLLFAQPRDQLCKKGADLLEQSLRSLIDLLSHWKRYGRKGVGLVRMTLKLRISSGGELVAAPVGPLAPR